MTPFNRLRQSAQQPEPLANPAPAGMPLQWQQGIGGEENDPGYGDAAAMLGQYLKRRQLQSHISSLTDKFTGRGGPISTTDSPLAQL